MCVRNLLQFTIKVLKKVNIYFHSMILNDGQTPWRRVCTNDYEPTVKERQNSSLCLKYLFNFIWLYLNKSCLTSIGLCSNFATIRFCLIFTQNALTLVLWVSLKNMHCLKSICLKFFSWTESQNTGKNSNGLSEQIHAPVFFYLEWFAMFISSSKVIYNRWLVFKRSKTILIRFLSIWFLLSWNTAEYRGLHVWGDRRKHFLNWTSSVNRSTPF